MKMEYKNILPHFNNIPQNPRSILSHFTDKNRIILFISGIILLNLVIILPTSALSYQSTSKVEFNINPTVSITINGGDLSIPSLAPGDSKDSNIITVTVSTNNVNGYHLDATVGDNNHSDPSFNTTNLTHSNNTNTFTSLSTNDSLPTLTTDNTWGYSYSNDSGTTWSNYSGLPIYTATSGALLDNQYAPGTYTTNFKIAAKAGSSQIAGDYTNVINFTATTFPSPLSLEEAYAYYGKQKVEATDPNTGITGQYYTMQDMEPGICGVADMESKAQVVDIRDNTVYWIGKAKDGNCWMTQNLKLGKQTDTLTLTQDTSNVDENGFVLNGKSPDGHFPRETIDGIDEQSDSSHYSCRNSYGCYYNWYTATAGTGSSHTAIGNASNDICPANWILPTGGANGQFQAISNAYSNSVTLILVDDPAITIENTTGKIPGFLLGGVGYEGFTSSGSLGLYWARNATTRYGGYNYYLLQDKVNPLDSSRKSYGSSIRCIAK